VLSQSDEVLEHGYGDEFLDEELRVEDGNVSGTADEVVGGACRQRVTDVVADKVDVRLVDDRLQNVLHHLSIHRT